MTTERTTPAIRDAPVPSVLPIRDFRRASCRGIVDIYERGLSTTPSLRQSINSRCND